jgi:6-phosphofructokinase 1
MSTIKTIGLLTGGGDAPGLNAVIRSVVKTAAGVYNLKVVGVEDGFEGLLSPTQTREMKPENVRGLLPRGGTILGTRNRGRFVVHDTGGGRKPEESFAEAIENLGRLGIDGLVVLGGEGSLGIAHEFDRYGVPVIGVPKTIDNDLAATEMTFGFMTALDIATEALDRLHTTAASHDRVMVLEVMGRHTGWIALHSGISGGADVILIPEIPFTVEAVVEKVHERERCDSQFTIVVAAEGAAPVGGQEIYQDPGGSDHAPRLGGVGNYVAHEIERLTGKESRCVVLGHLQRGGTPNAFDRMLATNYGSCAVHALMRGEHGKMVALRAADIITVPLSKAVADVKTVPVASQLVRTARDVGISFGAPDEAQHHGKEVC